MWHDQQLLGERVQTPQGAPGVISALFTPVQEGKPLGRWALVLLDDGDYRRFALRELTIDGESRS
jgi:hypothetical protein